ncbi:MAG: DUF2304 domain-containing protein [Oscillospiraceae bacterium]|nr:DUF2304 domain-containing protein [Oscillospiraceae bacterium]
MIQSLRIFLAVSILVYFVILMVMLRKKMLSLKYTIVWIVSGLFMVIFIIFPQLIFDGSAFIGISNPVNAIFFLAIGFSIILLLSLTSIVSTLNERNLRLTQALGLIEERVNSLEKQSKQDN